MKCIATPIYLEDGKLTTNGNPIEGKSKTITHQILMKHHTNKEDDLLHLTFDSLTSHDITYVGIIQTARASGLKEFPVPYVLTNCHNTLCAVGGTINEDDHQFALSAAHKYGGIYVPPNLAVIHSYNREMMTGCGKMILGSDSHTRYGALGTMGIGEGGGEIAKQLLKRTYDIAYPKVVLVYVTGKPKPGIGPHDVALELVQKTYDSGFVKNAILEFVGPGIANLSPDFRNGIDVMTTETTCLSSIWQTDDITKQYYIDHNRPEDFAYLLPQDGAYYDCYIDLNLDEVESMIALPMHPSRAITIHELQANPQKYFQETEDYCRQTTKQEIHFSFMDKIQDGNLHIDQAIIAGCAGGTYENIVATANILNQQPIGNETFRLSIYPDSLPIYQALVENGTVSSLLNSGAIFREAFCGPCFGAGDTPANGELSIRHTTRNFPNREGSKPNEGQFSFVALMDARSIAATARNHGILTAATDVVEQPLAIPSYTFNQRIYETRVYNGYQKAEPEYELKMGPNIKDWPLMPTLANHLLIKVVSSINDPVTTTDELIPSGETSSYRSNPLRLAEFTLSRRDPNYVSKAKQVQLLTMQSEEVKDVLKKLEDANIKVPEDIQISSAIYANKPGDGSAREQAASCQRVLGAGANFAKEYATKRYRSNCINWGILPFLVDEALPVDTWIYITNCIDALTSNQAIDAYLIQQEIQLLPLQLGPLTKEEKDILLAGCLINYYK